jgi:hypothetical protein
MDPFVRGSAHRNAQRKQIHGGDYTFRGMSGHTLWREGTIETPAKDIVVIEFAFPDKMDRLKLNNVTHYSKTEIRSGESCLDIITKCYTEFG